MAAGWRCTTLRPLLLLLHLPPWRTSLPHLAAAAACHPCLLRLPAALTCSMFSTLRPCARSLSMAAALTVSLVCEESMRETRVWYSMSAVPPSSDSASDPIVSTTAVRSARSSTIRSYVALQPAGGSSSGEAAAFEAARGEGFALLLAAALGLAMPFEESATFLAFGLATAFEESLSGVAAVEAAFLPASVAFMQSGRARRVATIKARGWVSERERARIGAATRMRQVASSSHVIFGKLQTAHGSRVAHSVHEERTDPERRACNPFGEQTEGQTRQQSLTMPALGTAVAERVVGDYQAPRAGRTLHAVLLLRRHDRARALAEGDGAARGAHHRLAP